MSIKEAFHNRTTSERSERISKTRKDMGMSIEDFHYNFNASRPHCFVTVEDLKTHKNEFVHWIEKSIPGFDDSRLQIWTSPSKSYADRHYDGMLTMDDYKDLVEDCREAFPNLKFRLHPVPFITPITSPLLEIDGVQSRPLHDTNRDAYAPVQKEEQRMAQFNEAFPNLDSDAPESSAQSGYAF